MSADEIRGFVDANQDYAESSSGPGCRESVFFPEFLRFFQGDGGPIIHMILI